MAVPNDATYARILKAAKVVGATQGLSMRMEDVAAEADLNRRTLFRYFGAREPLIKAAFESALAEYARRIPVPTADDEPHEWLTRALIEVNVMNARIGRLWWDLATRHSEGSHEEADDIYDPQACAAIVETFAQNAWTKFGGNGTVPANLVVACAMYTSVFVTHTLQNDYGLSPTEAATRNAHTLSLLFRGGVAAQRDSDFTQTFGDPITT
ncbi:TetR/AcrR family transcriptional regulator [Mycolicibacterium litorale]|uniref:TetR/AcrR family transcriptional regulator n=1 Tax=Mycolicibacterium litorale TaxID=758802 RepID=UPI003CE840EF